MTFLFNFLIINVLASDALVTGNLGRLIEPTCKMDGKCIGGHLEKCT
jgi:hypothetical protein